MSRNSLGAEKEAVPEPQPSSQGAECRSLESPALDPVAAPDGNVEIELKLDCDPDRLDETARAVEAHRCGPEGAHDLRTVYYDTADLALLGSGSVLRVRTDGECHAMTLKARKPENGKVLERTEWTATVASARPDRSALARLIPADLFAPISGAPLRPLFSTEVHRRTSMLKTPLGIVELALDRGRIVAGRRSREIAEIELELKAGETEALFQLGRELVSLGGARPCIESKSERGFNLALDRAPAPARARPISFPRHATLEGALDLVLRTTLQHMMESQPAAEDGRDSEGLHQYRISLRRLRSALDLARSAVQPPSLVEGFRHAARWLMSELNDARDWDVFVVETLPAVARACPSVEGFLELRRLAESRRSAAHERARKAIRDKRTGLLQIDLALWIEQKAWRAADSCGAANGRLSHPARSFARDALDGLQRRVLKRGRRFESLSSAELHRLRIAVKKLRYAAEFLYPLCGKSGDVRRHARALSRLQDELGRSNDLAVVDRLVHSLTDSPAEARVAAGAVLGWTAGRLSGAGDGVAAAWKDFRALGLT